MPFALCEEDGLYLGPEIIEIERGCRWSTGRLGARHSGGWVLGQQRSQEQNKQGDAHHAPPPHQQAGSLGRQHIRIKREESISLFTSRLYYRPHASQRT